MDTVSRDSGFIKRRDGTVVSARQRSLSMAATAGASNQMAQAKKEQDARVAAVTGRNNGYDPVTGDWLITTPDGGTIRAQSLTNGALTGKRLAVQRFGDSQTSAVNAPPSDTSGGNVTSQVESAKKDVVTLLAIESMPFRIEASVVEAGTYTLDPYQHYAVRIEALEGVSGATVAVSPAVGEIADVGAEISITLSDITDPPEVVLGSILLRRV